MARPAGAAAASGLPPLAALVAGADAAPASLARVLAADAPGAPGAGAAAYAGRTWAGEPLLLLLTPAPRGGAALEARSPSRALPAALAADAPGWVADLSARACELAPPEPDDAEAARAAAHEADAMADASDDDADWAGPPAGAGMPASYDPGAHAW